MQNSFQKIKYGTANYATHYEKLNYMLHQERPQKHTIIIRTTSRFTQNNPDS